MPITIDNAKQLLAVMGEVSRLARAVHKIDEKACNMDLSKRDDSRRDNALLRIGELARPYGWVLFHQSDPRGLPVYLVPKDWPCDKVRSQYNEGIGIGV